MLHLGRKSFVWLTHMYVESWGWVVNAGRQSGLFPRSADGSRILNPMVRPVFAKLLAGMTLGETEEEEEPEEEEVEEPVCEQLEMMILP